ncbi:MAG: type II toxin-antitoxin system HipA family toxin, partial [Gammaproteobacteria bacterium]|nr:type II toxin-antitoxin system HipA family toxin [Gammaproteobacteria bacterium]MBU1554953.1 type II toxin-antitoxin system HipA family toxin [Gammaproteobacteria bacterium]
MVAKVCKVMFDDNLVGALQYIEDRPAAAFEYSPEWIRDGFSLAPIHLPLRPGVFTFPNLSYETYKGLPAIFSDSLPDDFGNAIIDSWQARKGLDATEFKPIDRLLYTGKRGMGALEYQPTIQLGKEKSFEVDLAELVWLSQKVLTHREEFTASLEDDDSMTALLQIGTSAGGARPKAVIAINKDRTKVLSGQVDAPEGFEHYLIKFDGIREKDRSKQTFGDPVGYGVMEFVYYLMAKDCGIDMQPCELFEENGRRHFMTKRFDRVENQKYHCATLCAIDHADYKKPGHYSYEQLLGVMRKIKLTY